MATGCETTLFNTCKGLVGYAIIGQIVLVLLFIALIVGIVIWIAWVSDRCSEVKYKKDR